MSVSMSNTVTFNKLSHTSVITINNPPVNSLSSSLIASLNEIVDSISNNTKVLILKSNGNGFCAGADLKERSIMNDKDTIKTVDSYNSLFNKIEAIKCTTICAIHGFALGGGLELALSCDFRFATIDSKIGFPETRIGIIPGAGGTQRLTRLVGPSLSKKWIFTAEKYSASEALKDKVIDNVFNDIDSMNDYIQNISSKIKKNSYRAISLSKKSINFSLSSSIKDGLAYERELYLKTLSDPTRSQYLKKFTKK